MSGARVRYLYTGVWPLRVGLATSKQAFDAEMKRLKVDGEKWMPEGAGGCCKWFEPVNGSAATSIICIDMQGLTQEQIPAVLAHEAVHTAQFLWKYVREKKPGREAEAYLVEAIVEFCMTELANRRKGASRK